MTRLERIRNHDLIERVGHWVHLLNMILLVLSGLQIHFPPFNVFGSLNNARYVHFVDMYLFMCIGVFHVYRFFAAGKYRVAGPTPHNLRGFGATVKYYAFLSDEKPTYCKYNPLQIVTYFLLFALSALMAVVGFAMYWPVQLSFIVEFFGGLMTLRQVHYILSWVFISFSMFHLYLVLTQEPFYMAKSMVTGTYWRKEGERGFPECAGPSTSTTGPGPTGS